jgi:ADP-heptose:LPS heptosyltransferase
MTPSASPKVVWKSRQVVAPSILVLKLDHLGDFIIGLPALQRLRAEFPASSITLVCGSWNVAMALRTGLFERVLAFDFFPQNARSWDGTPLQTVEEFSAVVRGHYDIAVDLRVDEDTRSFLSHVDAELRCGIGSREQFPFLDAALPLGHDVALDDIPLEIDVPAAEFRSCMRAGVLGALETNFPGHSRELASSPALELPPGFIRATFRVGVTGRGFGARNVAVMFEALAGGETISRHRFDGRGIAALTAGSVTLDFINRQDGQTHLFRILSDGRPFFGKMTLYGLKVEVRRLARRAKAADMHVGEKLSLLAALVSERVKDLYAGSMFRPAGEAAAAPEGDPPLVAIAPMSNSSIRDWPLSSYRRLVQMMLDRLDCRIVLLGSKDQRPPLEEIVVSVKDDVRVQNVAGLQTWSEVSSFVPSVDLVICNNSGIAHLAAASGVPTLAIYSGSHDFVEWGPRGPAVAVISTAPPCAPCALDKLSACQHQHVCMTAITPEAIFEQARLMLESREVGVRPRERAA